MKTRFAFASAMVSLMLAASVLPAFADTASNGTAAGGTAPASAAITPPAHKTIDLACMQTAVEKRDNAIIAAVDAYGVSVKSALQTRRDALKAAWGISDKKERRQALRAAWTAFRGTWRDGAKALRFAKRDAWAQFYKDQKACSGNNGDEPAGGQGADAQL